MSLIFIISGSGSGSGSGKWVVVWLLRLLLLWLWLLWLLWYYYTYVCMHACNFHVCADHANNDAVPTLNLTVGVSGGDWGVARLNAPPAPQVEEHHNQHTSPPPLIIHAEAKPPHLHVPRCQWRQKKCIDTRVSGFATTNRHHACNGVAPINGKGRHYLCAENRSPDQIGIRRTANSKHTRSPSGVC